MQNSQGFSFIELLVTLVIMGVLAMMAVPAMQMTVQRQKEAELKSSLYDIRTTLDNYKTAYDNKRIRNEIGASGYPPNLQILVDGVIDERNPDKDKIYFLRRLPQDPLVSPRQGVNGNWGIRSYASSADDPKEGADVYDIYSTATGVGLNGNKYSQW